MDKRLKYLLLMLLLILGCSTEPEDCAGVAGGTAVEDCAGVPGGDAVEDECGVCGGDGSNCLVYDIDGNGYTTVTIGTQEWLVQNLKTTKYKDGTAIPTGHSNSDWANLSTGAYAVYDDISSNADVYGNLYNWYAVDDRGVCPEGFHVPSDEEYTILTDYLGGDAGGKMKETDLDHWDSPNTGATNESGFTGLPAGYRDGSNGNYGTMGSHGAFWSSSEDGSNDAWYRVLSYNHSSVTRDNANRQGGFSIRCLGD